MELLHSETARFASGRRTFGYFSLLATTTFVLGCGGASQSAPRVPLQGAVTYNAEPVLRGTIVLTPAGAGQPVSTNITSGRFAFNRDDGPMAGGYHATITRAGAEEVERLPTNRGFGAGGRNFPPPKKPVNRAGEKNSFEVDLEVDSSGVHDFALKD